jgi:hypothetical protein
LNRIHEVRNGGLTSAEWGKRFSGEGEIANAIHKFFKINCEKYGLNKTDIEIRTDLFTRPENKVQTELF